MRLAGGPAACMNYQFTLTSQAWYDDPQQPERRPLAQTKHDAFVTSASYREYASENLAITGSDDGWSPVRQLLICNLWTNLI